MVHSPGPGPGYLPDGATACCDGAGMWVAELARGPSNGRLATLGPGLGPICAVWAWAPIATPAISPRPRTIGLRKVDMVTPLQGVTRNLGTNRNEASESLSHLSCRLFIFITSI